MIDLLLHNLRTIGTHHCDGTVGEEAADEIERLRAEVAGLREDAERYRWLRDGDLCANYPYPVMRVGGNGHDYSVWFEELDAAIDAARKGEA